MTKLRNENGWGIFQLWLNWLMGSGALSLLVILSLWVRPLYMPFVAFGLQLIIFLMIRRNRKKRIPSCYLLPFIVTRVLFWTGIVMIIVNILYSDHLFHLIFDPSKANREIPFICMLITSPIATIITAWGFVKRNSLAFCSDCKIRNGTPAERGFLGVIFTQIGQYQVGMLFWLSAVLTLIGWTYYAIAYVNVSISIPDRFFFFLLPFLLWVAAAIYLALRYIGIWGYYRQNIEGSLERQGSTTQLRFILIWDNFIALRHPETDADKKISLDEKFDTPIGAFVRKQDNITPDLAETYFKSFSGLTSVSDLRFMYSNIQGNADCNIFHYLCFLNDQEKEQFDRLHPDCSWYPLPDVAKMINTHRIAPLMAAEIIRLHTIASAWKAFDYNGHRRYKIKHYRPTFHIRDIKKWDIDYNDPHWLYVADNNQDTPFYTIRRLWRKFINGIEE